MKVGEGKIGALTPGKKPSEEQHQALDFMIDENGFIYGVKALCHLTIQYMNTHSTANKGHKAFVQNHAANYKLIHLIN